MGPRPPGRGNVNLAAWLVAMCGPASMGPRPPGRGNETEQVDDRVVTGASMGPRPPGRGNRSIVKAVLTRRKASMGPRPPGRGNDVLKKAPNLNVCASMGPRPPGRGNMDQIIGRRLAPGPQGLQWGRDLPVAEILSLSFFLVAI